MDTTWAEMDKKIEFRTHFQGEGYGSNCFRSSTSGFSVFTNIEGNIWIVGVQVTEGQSLESYTDIEHDQSGVS